MDHYETEHLSVDHGCSVWFGHLRLGLLEDDPTWPRRLGPEPAWFADELAELHDQHDDAQGNDYQTAARAVWSGR